MGAAPYETAVRLQVQVLVRDSDASYATSQQDIEDTLDLLEKLIADVRAQGCDAWYLPTVDDIVAHVTVEAREGDVVKAPA